MISTLFLPTLFAVSQGSANYKLGFDYPQYFIRLFKRYVGVLPNEFRMMN
jgi:AraC-like DNA-binding protein